MVIASLRIHRALTVPLTLFMLTTTAAADEGGGWGVLGRFAEALNSKVSALNTEVVNVVRGCRIDPSVTEVDFLRDTLSQVGVDTATCQVRIRVPPEATDNRCMELFCAVARDLMWPPATRRQTNKATRYNWAAYCS